MLRNREFVPPYGHGASMYIRPLLFASGPMLGLAPLAPEFTFFVCVMPAGGYFQKPEVDPLTIGPVRFTLRITISH